MNLISPEELKTIKEIKGEVFGAGLKDARQFVLEKEGREGLKKVEEEMEKLGYPLKYEEIERYKWYPCSLDILFYVLCQKVFGWDDKILQEWGRQNVKTYFLTQLMMKYFVSLEVLAKNTGRYWRKFYTTGEVTIKEINKKERYLIGVLKDFKTLPAFLHYLEGYFYQILSFILPKEKLKVEWVGGEIEKGEYLFKATW